jgi:hypothetical protein
MSKVLASQLRSGILSAYFYLSMGQQHNKKIKRRRLKAYLTRRKQRENASIGGSRSLASKKIPSTKRSPVKKTKSEE